MESDKAQNPIAKLASLIRRLLDPSWREEFAGIAAQDKSVVLGRKQAARGEQAAALTSFMAFYGHRSSMGHLIRRRNSHVIFDLLKLSDTFEPAKTTIITISHEIEVDIRAQTASEEDVSDWCTIVRHLGQFDRAWELYNSLINERADIAEKLTAVIYGQLVGQKRYKEALATALENARWTLEEVNPKPKNTDEKAQLFTYWLPSVYEAYEVLQAMEEKEWCTSLEKWALSIGPQPAIYDGLIKAALRAEKSETAERLAEAKLQTFKA